MSVAENKEIYRRFIQEVFNEGRLERVTDFTAPDYQVREAPPGASRGSDAVKQIVTMFRTGFPNLNIVIEELIGEGEWLAARATTHGTHTGPIFGVAPTGRKIAFTGLTLVRIKDGKLCESWVKNDVPALMAQLGSLSRVSAAPIGSPAIAQQGIDSGVSGVRHTLDLPGRASPADGDDKQDDEISQ